MTYTLPQELLINSMTKEKIWDLQQELHDKKSLLSDRQRSLLSSELKQYQDLLNRNHLDRQIETR